MPKPLDKMTKAELLVVIDQKDRELAALRNNEAKRGVPRSAPGRFPEKLAARRAACTKFFAANPTARSVSDDELRAYGFTY